MASRLQTLQNLLKKERLPAAVVDLDAFDENVHQIAAMVRAQGQPGQTLRIATKSLRVPALIARVLQQGLPFQGLMCFTAEEARFLASQGFDDLLVAYPTVLRQDFAILRKLHESGRDVQLVLDDLHSVRMLSEAMSGIERPFPVVLEIDLALRFFGGRIHLGARRSPIRSAKQAIAFAEQCRHLPGVELRGIMAYESQVAGLGDRNPVNRWTNPIIRLIRRYSAIKIARFRKEVSEAFRERGLTLTLFNGGGTGSLTYAVDEPWLTEVTAGSGFLQPHLFDHYSNLSLIPACYFAVQAVRTPDPGWITCLGGGYVASGAPGWDKVPLPSFPEGARLSGDEGCGEVQTPLRLKPGTQIRPGEPVLFRHAKAGELAERFNEYLLISGDQVVDRVKTYRGFGECIL